MNISLDKVPRTIAVEMKKSRPQVVLVDQRRLPQKLTFLKTRSWQEVVDAIKTMAVRGAPALGVAGAAAVMLRAWEWVACEEESKPKGKMKKGKKQKKKAKKRARLVEASSTPLSLGVILDLKQTAKAIKQARPTAVNLGWGVDQALVSLSDALKAGESVRDAALRLTRLTESLITSDELTNRTLGTFGAAYLAQASQGKPLTLLTHCNAGSLATAYYGTALGVIYALAQEGLIERVYADETRPVNQGARLTAWELSQAGIPVTLQCDAAAASLFAEGSVDAVIVGADRIAANGDVANKVGTLGLALMAHHYGVPFVVAAPLSTIDMSTPSGVGIPIEQRPATEVLPQPLSGVEVRNPAFDVTPYNLVSAIITETGLWEPSH